VVTLALSLVAARAEAEGATDQGATEIENALWRVEAAFEKLHDVIALGLGVPALKLNPNKKGIRRFESDRRENRKKLRELAADHKAAGAILEIDERINNHRFLALRHQMTHSLAPILAWRSLIWFEVGEIDDKGGVVAYRNLKQDSDGAALAPSHGDLDPLFSIGYGLGYGFGNRVSLDFVPDYAIAIHERSGLSNGVSNTNSMRSLRLALRMGFGSHTVTR